MTLNRAQQTIQKNPVVRFNMMSITDTNIPTPETIAQDWNAVVQHAKDMQLAIGRYVKLTRIWLLRLREAQVHE